MLIPNKAEFIKKFTLNSFSIEFFDPDTIQVINSIVKSAEQKVENYLGYPLSIRHIKQWVQSPTDEIYFVSRNVLEIITDLDIKFHSKNYVLLNSNYQGSVEYLAGWDEYTLPDEIKNAIARISIIFLNQYLNNTVANKSISKNIGGQTTEVSSVDLNAIQKELSKIDSYRTHLPYTIYNDVEPSTD